MSDKPTNTMTCKCGAARYVSIHVHLDHTECIYEPCDDPECRALKHPETLSDVLAALEHWKHHGLDNGCAHGC